MLRSRESTTGFVVEICWSARGNATARKRRWAALLRKLGRRPLGKHAVLLRKGTLDEIEEIIASVLLPSDTAIVVYPHGATRRGSSRMWVRVYGRV
jgi:hypothetical protein